MKSGLRGAGVEIRFGKCWCHSCHWRELGLELGLWRFEVGVTIGVRKSCEFELGLETVGVTFMVKNSLS